MNQMRQGLRFWIFTTVLLLSFSWSPKAYSMFGEVFIQQQVNTVVDILKHTTNDVMASLELESKLFKLLSELQVKKILRPVLRRAIYKAFDDGFLPKSLTQESLEGYLIQLFDSIDFELMIRGLAKETKKQKIVYLDWDKIANIQNKIISDVMQQNEQNGEEASLESKTFQEQLAQISGATWNTAQEVIPLINGSASFPLRERLMRNAKHSIYVLTWGMDNDFTGQTFADLLIQRKTEDGIDVRVIVDYNTAKFANYNAVPQKLEKAGVPLVRWKDSDLPYFGTHRKILIIDGEMIIAGGMNFGDVYSHLGPIETPKWRDTDIFIRGTEVATTATKLFRRLFGKSENWYNSINNNENENIPTLLIDQHPNTEGRDTIMLSLLLSIANSKSSIDITNAYYIATPAIQEALIKAHKRGVKIRVLTNSQESVDVPVISHPIINSVRPLVAEGIDVYLKRGATLHAKVALFDKKLSFVKSYNFHPQSVRSQGEVALAILDIGLGEQLCEAFEKDIATENAKYIDNIEEVTINNTMLDIITSRYLFNQL